MEALTIKDGVGTAAGAGLGFLISLAVKKKDKGLAKHKAIIGLVGGAAIGFAFTYFVLPKLQDKLTPPVIITPKASGSDNG